MADDPKRPPRYDPWGPYAADPFDDSIEPVRGKVWEDAVRTAHDRAMAGARRRNRTAQDAASSPSVPKP